MDDERLGERASKTRTNALDGCTVAESALSLLVFPTQYALSWAAMGLLGPTVATRP